MFNYFLFVHTLCDDCDFGEMRIFISQLWCFISLFASPFVHQFLSVHVCISHSYFDYLRCDYRPIVNLIVRWRRYSIHIRIVHTQLISNQIVWKQRMNLYESNRFEKVLKRLKIKKKFHSHSLRITRNKINRKFRWMSVFALIIRV